MGLFDGKIGLIMGVANERSIAWGISESLYAQGAELIFTHLPGPRNERRVRQLTDPKNAKLVVECDVQKDEDLDRTFATIKEQYGKLDFMVHSIAFAPTDELRAPYAQASRAGWHLAMDISAYSLVATSRRAADLMTDGGTIITLTYYGGEAVIPGYNIMGVCKAALEHSVRYLAFDLGRRNVRVNAISAGPIKTLSSAGGISDFDKMLERQAEKSCLGVNITQADLGKTACYLLSSMSSGVTGELLHVDSGFNIVGI